MSEYKKEISAAVVAAIVIAAGLGAIAIYSFPGMGTFGPLTSTTVNSGVSTSTTSASLGVDTLNVTVFSTTNLLPTPTTTSFTPASWEPGQAVGLVLNSSTVQSYIRGAYSYDASDLVPSASNPNLIIMTINATGTQSVKGNWTTGYEVSYMGIRTLNATVQFAEPSSYTLQGVAVTVLPNVTQSITYDSNQQQVIRVALSNATGTIKELMGTAAFYVASVTSAPIQNGTYAGDYFALIYQVNGPNLVGVFVNGGITAVVNAYTASRAETMCWTLGTPEGVPASANQVCFTSPWSSVSTLPVTTNQTPPATQSQTTSTTISSSCSGYPPGGDCLATYNYTFTISVNYSGSWKLNYQGYNCMVSCESNPLNVSGNYTGSGFYSKAVTLSGLNNNGLTLCATAQKLDGSNSTLVLTVTGYNETSLPYGSTSYCGGVVP